MDTTEDVLVIKSSPSSLSSTNPMISSQTKISELITIPPQQQIAKIEIETTTIEVKEEPYYQVPKSCEPYYEIPKPPKPVPLYENVDMFYSGSQRLSLGGPVGGGVVVVGGPKEPPKEKPPPPPVDYAEEEEEEEEEIVQTENEKSQDPFRRINSTRRIKNEIRTQRSSFLGIAGTNDDNYLELSIAPPPDMISLLREEKRLEKQFYLKAGLYDNSDTGDSRDSGVSENHSRQSSELFTSSEELDDFGGRKGDNLVENQENQGFIDDDDHHLNHHGDNEMRMKTIEDQIREQEVRFYVPGSRASSFSNTLLKIEPDEHFSDSFRN